MPGIVSHSFQSRGIQLLQRAVTRDVRGRNVLIYWPHGFGDWLFFGYFAKLLEPSNRYFITRFGDNNVSLFEGCEFVKPFYLGLNSTHCDDGRAFGIQHFGLNKSFNKEKGVRHFPAALYDQCQRHNIDLVVDLPFWETQAIGRPPFIQRRDKWQDYSWCRSINNGCFQTRWRMPWISTCRP